MMTSLNQAATAPRTWLVLGDKLGDNAQVEIIVRALGWAAERRQLVFREEWRDGKPPFRADLYHIDLEASAALEAPWPDVVLTSGRRPAMAALWIKEQSGGRTRVVLVGRPKKWLARFDLVVAPAQYPMPAAPNVHSLGLPLMRLDHEALERAGEAWRERFADLPRPLTAVLIGGETKPFRFDGAVARELMARLGAISDGGTLYVTTSRRTRPDVLAALEHGLPPGARLFAWSAGAVDNPYRGLLALADRFVVSGDSVSMMVEVARLGRPLAIFGLPVRGVLERMRGWLARLAARVGIPVFPRDLRRIHRRLFDLGAAVPLGQPFSRPSVPLPDELETVADRVREVAKAAVERL